MRYGEGFWAVRDGVRITNRNSPFAYPATRGFEYADGTGDRGEFLLEPFTVDYAPPGWKGGRALRMTVRGAPAPVLHRNAFDFDWASIPTRLGRALSCDKADYRIRVGSLYHDMLFCAHVSRPLLDLRFANELLPEIMEAYSDSTAGDWWLRRKVHAAVCVGGPALWDKPQREIDIYRALFDVEIVAA